MKVQLCHTWEGERDKARLVPGVEIVASVSDAAHIYAALQRAGKTLPGDEGARCAELARVMLAHVRHAG